MRKGPVGHLRELSHGRCIPGSGRKVSLSKENDVLFHALHVFSNNLLLSFMSIQFSRLNTPLGVTD